ncbi:unnamed protein product [Callosobruchus maculatus]|uniref:Uncharacterized protein n=1 Tax=Callosobruchus maculatus TaxID=64391 RepID=A0A653CA26_CALMS|nr:unnamed protein product [Callosobruchus maculatus]VEN54283.1 unnamed protein product [Callosobruchus maculatus]
MPMKVKVLATSTLHRRLPMKISVRASSSTIHLYDPIECKMGLPAKDEEP